MSAHPIPSALGRIIESQLLRSSSSERSRRYTERIFIDKMMAIVATLAAANAETGDFDSAIKRQTNTFEALATVSATTCQSIEDFLWRKISNGVSFQYKNHRRAHTWHGGSFMLHTSAAMFTFFARRYWQVVIIIASAALTLMPKVDLLADALVGPSHFREADRPDGNDERKLLAELERVQRAATEDLNPERFDRDMGAAFLAYGLDLNRIETKVAAAKLAGCRSTAEVVAAIDDWCSVRRRELGAQSWRQLADLARAADADPWRNALRDQFDRPPAEAIPALRARAAEIEALKRQPVRSLMLLVRMLWDAGDPGTSMPVLNIAEGRFPDDFWVCIEQGNLNMVDAPIPDPLEAARYFSRAIAVRPLSPAAHENLANALVDQKKYDDAIAEFQVAIKLNSDNPETYKDLGEALLLQGRTAEAIATLELAIQIRPDFHDAHFALGVALGSQGRKGQAVAAFEEAIRLNPGLIDAQDRVRIDRGRDEALAALRTAIQNLPRPLAARPGVVIKVANDEKLRPIAEDGSEESRPKRQAAGHIDHGCAWINQKEFDKAIADFNEAIRLEPGCPDAYIHRAFAWSGKQEYNKAIADYDKAVMLAPRNAAAYNDRAWLRATCPVEEFRDANKALESAIWACALSGWKNAHSLGTLAASYAEARDFASAVKCQTKAMRLLGAERERRDFAERLELYRRGKAYRQAPPE
jgi:tetratricopeptide (TPR) repeat protein